MINLKHIGCNYKEDKEFIIDRPKGSMDYLFLMFHSDVNMKLNHNIEHVDLGSVILFTPDFPQYYYNSVGGIHNDWFHFTEDQYEKFVTELQFPVNQPIILQNSAFVHKRLLEIEKEHITKDIGSEIKIDHLITNLIIDISREYNRRDTYKMNPYYYELEIEFRELRTTMLSNLHKHWTIDELSARVDLSRSRFSFLYKSFFGISPKGDLLNERFYMAKHLLTSNTQSVTTVALNVGYENIYQFSKQFKKITSLSPREYRLKYSDLLRPETKEE